MKSVTIVKKPFKRVLSSILALCIIFTMPVFTTVAFGAVIVNPVTINDKEVVITGKILNYAGRGIAGESITMLTFTPGVSVDNLDPSTLTEATVQQILSGIGETLSETVSDVDGSYTLRYTMRDDAAAGMYTAVIGGRTVSTPTKINFYYISPVRESIILNAFKNSNSGNVASVIDLYKDELLLNYNKGYNSSGFNKIPVQVALAGKTFSTAEEIKNQFYYLVALERIKQAPDVSTMAVVLTEQVDMLSQWMGSYYDVYKNIVNDKNPICSSLLPVSFTNSEGVAAVFTKAVSDQLQLENHAIHLPEMTISSAVGIVGQQVSINLTCSKNDNIQTITELHLDMQYDPERLFIANQSAVSIKESVLNGKIGTIDISTAGHIKLDYSSLQVTSFSNKPICTVNFGAKAEVSSSAIRVSGTVAYLDKLTDSSSKSYTITRNIDVKDMLLGSATITKSNATTNSGGGSTFFDPVPTATPLPTLPPQDTPAPTPIVESTVSQFTDLDSVPWAKESIEALAVKGIVSGPGGNIFEPQGKVTRAQFVKMLIKALQLEDDTATVNFSDVSKEDWCYKYVASAQKYGITNGLSDGSFGVNQEITRQELAVMTYRAVTYANISLPSNQQPLSFSDMDQIASYAVESIITMNQAGIINGMGDNRFAPNETTTRAMAAKVIYEILKYVK